MHHDVGTRKGLFEAVAVPDVDVFDIDVAHRADVTEIEVVDRGYLPVGVLCLQFDEDAATDVAGRARDSDVLLSHW